jgi:hypothetical protein
VVDACPSPTPSDRLKIEADAYRLLLIGGLVTVTEVIRWADETIEATTSSPSIEIIDVSLSGSRGVGALVTVLGRIPGRADVASVSRRVFAAMDEILTQDAAALSRVAILLEHMAVEGTAPDKEARSEMFSAHEELWSDEAQQYMLSPAALSEIRAFLRRHQ